MSRRNKEPAKVGDGEEREQVTITIDRSPRYSQILSVVALLLTACVFTVVALSRSFPVGSLLAMLTGDAYAAYQLVLLLRSRIVVFADKVPRRFDLFRRHRRLNRFGFLFLFVSITVFVAGILLNSHLISLTGFVLIFLSGFLGMLGKYWSFASVIMETSGELEPNKELVNSMVLSLPYLVMTFGLFLFFLLALLPVDISGTYVQYLGFLTLLVVLFYVLYVELPFRVGRRRWKRWQLESLHAGLRKFEKDEERVLGSFASEVSKHEGSSDEHPSLKMIMQLLKSNYLELTCAKIDRYIDRVEKCSDSPYGLVKRVGGAFLSIIALWAVELSLQGFVLLFLNY